MPTDCFMTFDKSTNGLRRKSHNMMNINMPFQNIDKNIIIKVSKEHSGINSIKPLSKKYESKIRNDTFIYHEKVNQEITDTCNLFHNIQEKHKQTT